MVAPKTPSETFTGLREQLFRSDPATLAPAEDSASSNVIGVVMESRLGDGSYLVYGLRDGSASLYLSSGGGWLGGHEKPRIHAAAKNLVAVAAPFAHQFPLVHEYPIPAAGKVRFSFFMTEGIRAAETDEAEFEHHRGELYPVFAAAQEIVSGFRELADEETGGEGAANEPSYANCLLTTLGRGTAPSVTLTAGEPLPDPSQLTSDPSDLAWIAEANFALDRLSSAQVIRMILHFAGYRWFRFWKTEGHFAAKLANHDGESFTDMTFRVHRRRHDGRTQIEIVAERPV
jgi:hypothetical protein